MEFRDSGSVLMVRLYQDEDLFASLREACLKSGLKTGIVVSGIGMLKQSELSFFLRQEQYHTALFPEPLELVSLTGNVLAQDGDVVFHLHAVLARESKETVAGHLSKGKVNVTNEIAVLKTDIAAERRQDPATGLMALHFK
ncbi:MAG: DUF296 domain-containing protein [Candidatus Eisenbacteria bacterium]|nr:DUF296 domain-containing protein [Candidatus Eisenbacteria bacterium]